MEDARHAGDVHLLTAVRGRDDRQFPVGQTEGVGGAALDESDGLHGLGGRPEVGNEIRIAARIEEVPLYVHDS